MKFHMTTDPHVCEPSYYPTGPGEAWRCDLCGEQYVSWNISAEPWATRMRVPANSWGWKAAEQADWSATP